MPLKIAILSQAYHPAVGGVTEHVDQSAHALRARGHDVAVITARFSERGYGPSLPNGYPVFRIGWNVAVPYNGAENNLTVGFGMKRRLEALLARERFDLLHVHCPVSPVLPLLALRIASQPVVGTFHSTVMSDLAFRLFRRALLPSYRRLDRALAVSEEARACVLRHFPGPVDIVPNGVDPERFRPGLERLPRFDGGVPTVLFVGRHDPRKGLPELIDACGILARRGLRFRLVIVGDGVLRRRIEARARATLGDRVHFEGRVSNERLPRYYASAEIFCSPARGGESFGIVLLEAMASGVPVVATDLPGYRTVLTPGREGLMAPPRDAAALAEALAALLLDPARRAAMGARGVETARRFAWTRIAARLEEVYGSLVGPERAAARLAPPPTPDPVLVSAEA